MQLKLITHYLQLFRLYLEGPGSSERLHIWASQRTFQENWDLEASNLAVMYDASLQSTYSRRLWNRESYEPKRMMTAFMEMEPGYVYDIFRDLFNENKDVAGRADRFIYYCDELLQLYKERHPLTKENSNYHNDNYQMVSLYLGFRYPAVYTLYDADAFRKLLQLLGSTDIPAANDIGRFFKVMRTLYGFMAKDEALMAAHRARLDENQHFMGESLLLSYDFYQFCKEG
jgi:hypothetical protein